MTPTTAKVSPASRKHHRDGHSANRDRNGSWFGHGHAMVRDTQSAQSADGAGDAVQSNRGHPSGAVGQRRPRERLARGLRLRIENRRD